LQKEDIWEAIQKTDIFNFSGGCHLKARKNVKVHHSFIHSL
jgi:hypothetical protein